MDTIQKQKIGLCIGGTKSRQSGFTPLMIAGILAGDESKNMDKVTLVVEKPAYVIKHTQAYILYMLIDRKVKSFDRESPGVLSIALTIMRDVQLADGKSPYSLLREVYAKFRNEYMKPGDDGFDNFIDKDVNQADFIAILEQYPLERRVSTYIPMKSSGLAATLCVPQEKMEDLFRDSQYREFAEFKEIEIGVDSSKTSSTKELANIEIPRPIIYSIQVNGKPIEQTMRHPDDYYDSAWENTPYVKYEQVNFTLKQLLEEAEHQIRSSSGKSSATLDLEHACIVCKIHTEEIKYLLEYEILGDAREKREELAYLLLNKGVKLTIGGNVIEFPLSSPKKTTIPASWAHQVVSYKAEPMVTFGFGVTSKVDDENKRVMVTIPIHTSKRDPYSGGFSGYQGRKYDLNVPATTQIYSGERIENDHEEDLEKLQPSNKQLSNKRPSKKTKKKWLLLVIIGCFIVGMCIGIFIERQTEWFAKDLTRDDSVQIASQAIKTIPFNSIFDFNTIDIDTIKNLKPLVNEIKSRYMEGPEEEAVDTVDTAPNVTKVEDRPTQSTQPTETEQEERQGKREYILQLVNEKNWQKFSSEQENLKQYLQQDELYSMIAFLWPDSKNTQYKNLTGKGMKKLKEEIGKASKFSSIEEVVAFRNNKINPILSKYQKEKK